ncbi:MAG: Ig-like domain-containing protein [Actinobacteria bacterium]|nr:Ig-like domain-containing protein [Actinomycetota bacterium]
MKRLLLVLGAFALATLGYVLGSETPAFACHWGEHAPPGSQCASEPEEAPYNPTPFLQIHDTRTSANSDLTIGWDHAQIHEEFTQIITADAAAGFDADLDLPNNGQQIGTINVLVRAIVGGIEQDANVPGEIFDANDGVNWPSGGVYKIRFLLHPTTGDVEMFGFVDENSGHLHTTATVPDDLIDTAQAANASIKQVRQRIFGKLGGQAFLTNPSTAGTFTFTSDLTGWDDLGNNLAPGQAHLEINGTIVNRVPQTATLSPATQTKRVVSQQATVTANVKDQAGENLAGALVDFNATGANPGLKCNDVATDANGNASCSYSGSNGGNDSVTATATKHATSVMSAPVAVSWREPTTLALTPENATRRTGTNHTVTANVKDQAGQNMQGEAVDFTVTGANPGLKCDDVITNASGDASCTYAGANPGDDVVTATVTIQPSETVSDTANAHWIQPTTLTLAPATATKVQGQQHTLTATVKDQDGNVMAGESVTFTRTGANPGSGSGTTNGSGQATHTYTGNNVGGDTVSASVSGTPASGTATVQWNAAVASSIDLTPATAQRSVGQNHTVTATVKDQIDRPMAGVNVDFAVTSGPHAGEGCAAVPTNGSGNATCTYTGTAAGTDSITASAGSLSDTATVEWIDQVPTTWNVSVTHDNGILNYGHPQHHTATGRAQVFDQDGNPMAGVEVSFEIDSGPNVGAGFDDVVTTDADGVAVWQYSGLIANGEGSDSIAVRATGTPLPPQGRFMTWKWHPCDNPNATYLNTFVQGGSDVDVNGNRVVVCWGSAHQH